MSCISFESCEIFTVMMFFARKYLFSLALLLFFHTRPQEEPTTWTGYFGKVLMASTTYLPAQVSEMFTQGRAFATVRLPFSGHKNICALAMCELLVLSFFFSHLFSYVGMLQHLMRNIILFSFFRIQKIPRLLVAAADGYLYLYNLDPQEGGECTLMKQHK